MDLNEIVIFTRVAQAESFAQAARELGMPKSTVSRKVAELEERLGARLVHRTTRKLSLTDAGRIYFDHGMRVMAEIEAAELSVSRMQAVPRGLLRVTAPIGMVWLGDIVSDFLRRYPEVEVSLLCTDRVVDLVEEGFDLAIRAGKLVDSSLVAKRLCEERWVLVASPDYLDRAEAVTSPSDLASRDCIVFVGGGAKKAQWTLERDGDVVHVPLEPRLRVNDIDMVKDATLAGLGIAMLPHSRCHAEIRRKRLRPVLPEWHAPAAPIHAVYPSTRHLSPKVRAFLDHLSERVKSLPL